MSSLVVAPKPKRIQSPRTDQDGENKESELWGFPTEDPSMEVKRILLEEFTSIPFATSIPLRRFTPKRKDSVAGEPFSPTRNPSPPIRSQNPFEAETAEMETHWDSDHEVGLILTERTTYPLLFEDIRSPSLEYREGDEADPVETEIDPCHPAFDKTLMDHDVEEDFHHEDADYDDQDLCGDPPPRRSPPRMAYSPPSPDQDTTGVYLAYPRVTPLAFESNDLVYDMGTHLVLQIATAPVTPCYKRKRGENISRSLPDIRFPDYLRHPPLSHYNNNHYQHPTYSQAQAIPDPSPKRSSSSSPFKSKSLPLQTPAISLLTSALLSRGRHRRSRSSQLALTDLIENVNEVECSGVTSPTQRYRHTVS